MKWLKDNWNGIVGLLVLALVVHLAVRGCSPQRVPTAREISKAVVAELDIPVPVYDLTIGSVKEAVSEVVRPQMEDISRRVGALEGRVNPSSSRRPPEAPVVAPAVPRPAPEAPAPEAPAVPEAPVSPEAPTPAVPASDEWTAKADSAVQKLQNEVDRREGEIVRLQRELETKRTELSRLQRASTAYRQKLAELQRAQNELERAREKLEELLQ